MSQTEIRALLEKAKASLAAAQTLLREGYADFAASRGYYAMFYVAEALLLALGHSYSKHAAVIAAFGREYAKTGALDPKFHRLLLDAYRIRNVGDYEIGTPVPKEKAEDICHWAAEFIQAAETYLSEKSSSE